MDLKSVIFCWSPLSPAIRLILFIFFITVLAVWMFLLPWLNDGASETSAPKSKATPSHNSESNPRVTTNTELPSILFGTNINDLRTTNAVRQLTNSENELSLQALPNGVFGWVESYKLDSPTLWMPGSAFAPDFPVAASSTCLRTTKKRTEDVEIHKARDGTVRISAFVNDATRLQLQQPSRSTQIQVLLAFQDYKEYRFAASIPRDRIQRFNHRTLDDGESIADATIG
jgi:hypothetical protein